VSLRVQECDSKKAKSSEIRRLGAIEVIAGNDVWAARLICVSTLVRMNDAAESHAHSAPLLVGQSAGSSQHLMQARGPAGSTSCSRYQIYINARHNLKVPRHSDYTQGTYSPVGYPCLLSHRWNRTGHQHLWGSND
jgi:hypothetical protein